MKSFIKIGKTNLNKFMGFFFLAVILLWLKTYVVQVTQFNLGVENSIQAFLLFLSPLASAILFMGMAMFRKGKKRYTMLLGIYFALSFILYANVLYYRFFNDFITLPTLTQTQNFGDVSGSIPSLLKPYDVLFFIDFFVLAFIFGVSKQRIKLELGKVNRRMTVAVLLMGLAIFSANLGMAEADRPQLLKRTFDRNYIVKYLGMYNYMIYDAVQSTKASAQRVMADSNDVTEVINYTQSQFAEPNPDYFGVAKGRNVIYVHLESVQNFLIDYELHGEEVTPFLNSLTRDSNTLYFDNFFHQTAQGKTADAEFMIENSLFGLPQGSAFSTKGLNTYQAAPAILGQKGYTSAVFHGNTKSFWNRDQIYKSFGYDKFFDSSYYDMSKENVANYGLKDKPFFTESIPLLQSLPQPFYSKFIMLSNHYPYPIDEEDATIAPHITGDKSVDTFFQTVRYSDEALEQFFADLKESGLYDNSIIILYGDHYGISENHNKAMEQVLGEEITPPVNTGLQRVPLYIHSPGLVGGVVNHQYGGQIDLLPTLLHLLGVESNEYVHIGTDLLSTEHRQLVAFRNGDFISPTVTAVDEKYYDTITGEILEQTTEIDKMNKIARQQLELSDKVVNGDLLRFYMPERFTSVDRSIYNYNTDETIIKED